jgi:hypothetical protein
MKNGELVMLLAPVLTPHGVLTLRPSSDGATLEPDRGSRLEKAFAKGPGEICGPLFSPPFYRR